MGIAYLPQECGLLPSNRCSKDGISLKFTKAQRVKDLSQIGMINKVLLYGEAIKMLQIIFFSDIPLKTNGDEWTSISFH